VGFQNSATGLELGVYAARSYSLIRPPRTGLRLIRSWERSAAGGRDAAVQLAAAMGPPSVEMRLVLGHHGAQMAFAEDRHPSVTSVRAVNTNRSAKAFARGLRGGIFSGGCPCWSGPRRKNR